VTKGEERKRRRKGESPPCPCGLLVVVLSSLKPDADFGLVSSFDERKRKEGKSPLCIANPGYQAGLGANFAVSFCFLSFLLFSLLEQKAGLQSALLSFMRRRARWASCWDSTEVCLCGVVGVDLLPSAAAACASRSAACLCVSLSFWIAIEDEERRRS